MFEKDTVIRGVTELGEESYVDPAVKIDGCDCPEQHRLFIALSERRGRPELFCPTHKGINKSYCATFGRRCGI